MKIPVLNGINRDKLGKNISRKTRRQGLIPAVVYGAPNKTISLNSAEMSEIIRNHGENAVVELNFGDTKVTTLIKSIQRHPVNSDIVHIDFKPVDKNEKITVKVPIDFTSTGKITSQGGIIQTHKNNINIECEANAIPKSIHVDVSKHNVGDILKVSDIEVGSEISIIDKFEEIIANITRLKVSE